MFVLKAFIQHTMFLSDKPGIVSTIGELSTYSLTFTKNKTMYMSSAIADELDIVVFKAAIDNVAVTLPVAVADHVGAISKYIYDHTINSSIKYTTTELLELLLIEYASKADTFSCGELITDGDFTIPEWVSWHTKIDGVDTNNTIKIWFVDTSFKEQYDDYEIVVIPPITPLDNFFSPFATVKKTLLAIDPTVMMDNIQKAKDGDPETVVRSETYTLYDVYNIENTTSTTWNFLIYGAAGDNIDSINDALVEYILSHSTKTRADWIQILPDIFKRTEFVLVPTWHKYGIPNRVLEAGIHSPIINVNEALTFINKVVKKYTVEHINKYAEVLANPYKSLSIVSIGGSDNKNNLFSIDDYFSDYISVAMTSNDFTRMTTATQEWAILISKMLIAAESMSYFTQVPSGMSKSVRDGVLYLSTKYDKINYLVASKMSVMELMA